MNQSLKFLNTQNQIVKIISKIFIKKIKEVFFFNQDTLCKCSVTC